VGALSAVDQSGLLTRPEAGALLHRPAEVTQQSTMGNAGTCTVQSTAPPLALVQWNVGVEALGARAYTTRLAELAQELADQCGSAPSASELPAEGLGDGARLLRCGTSVELVASTGGHLLLLTVDRPAEPANDDVVATARLLVSRLPQ
jgi:hypothetical protein